MAGIEWFYTKSKVPICLAITDSCHFLNKLKDGGILSEEEALELQGDTRKDHRVVYECLCWIEEKDISAQNFLEFLFQKSFLKKYPDLKPVYAEYKAGKYHHGIHSMGDEDKDLLIFAQDKVRICLTITNRFPFLHGLQDLTILSESESLKLQADERPVSRVIYESLSLIEKKDMKLNIVFEYIFQPCYLKLYPGLQDVLQDYQSRVRAMSTHSIQQQNCSYTRIQFGATAFSSTLDENGVRESSTLFNGGLYPMFSIATDIVDVFDHNKTYICEAVNERFPFLHGLHDFKLLSYLQLLKLQADKRSTIEVLYEALSQIRTIHDLESLFAYVFQEFYLKRYPGLHIILRCINAALTLDICPPYPEKSTEIPNLTLAVIVNDENIKISEESSRMLSTVLYEDDTRDVQEKEASESANVAIQENSSEPILVAVKNEMTELPEQNASEPSPVLYEDETRDAQEQGLNESHKDETREVQEQDSRESSSDSDNTLPPSVRKCRMQPISYSEPPDLDWEVNNRIQKHKAPESPKWHKYRKRKFHKTNSHAFIKSILEERPDPAQAPESPKWHKLRKRKFHKTNSHAFIKSRLEERPDPSQVTRPVSVMLEFPKQVFNDKFKVRCGTKTGIFMKSHWTGDSRNSLCICSEGKRFSVITFEKYGGKELSKNWKKSIHCEKIKLEDLMEAGILKPAKWTRGLAGSSDWIVTIYNNKGSPELFQALV
ncbi:uncharacterized protein LOC122939791 isoform X2 [Bufo gargarizans]|uniref:uncharacterized protein LOC122939791 isoform X2 n=1 Tax=Bufo gargarizans TaxID=30331 RepID=UPI001CF3D8CC|nr:uncharacterized protein LOC122939791 isoform X2 [Bufo gargarizans]